MRLLAEYQPAALFTLKHGQATSTGAKSLLVPTPFALRTALLDVAIRVEGVKRGPAAFEILREVKIAFCPPKWAVVTNLFAKVLKPTRADKESEEAMQRTIAFREYVHFEGEWRVMFFGEEATLRQLAGWLPHLTYLGRRGSFIQLIKLPEITADDSPPEGCVMLESGQFNPGGAFPLGVIQMLDEWGPTLTYEKVNVFEEVPIKRVGSGKDRLRFPLVVAYQFRRAGRGFTLYEYEG